MNTLTWFVWLKIRIWRKVHPLPRAGRCRKEDTCPQEPLCRSWGQCSWGWLIIHKMCQAPFQTFRMCFFNLSKNHVIAHCENEEIRAQRGWATYLVHCQKGLELGHQVLMLNYCTGHCFRAWFLHTAPQSSHVPPNYPHPGPGDWEVPSGKRDTPPS